MAGPVAFPTHSSVTPLLMNTPRSAMKFRQQLSRLSTIFWKASPHLVKWLQP